MDALFSLITPVTPWQFAAAFGIAVVAGMVKGLVGFAMPTVLISGLSTFLSPELALAGLILPTLFSNAIQALGQGVAQAWRLVARFRLFLIVGAVCLLIGAQMVAVVPTSTLLTALGVVIAGFAVVQLAGVRFHLRQRAWKIEVGVGALAGFIGGFSGAWGPPTVVYLTALDTPKKEQIQIQGAMYFMAAILLLLAHSGSGVLNARTLPLSVALLVPSLLGVLVGTALNDRINQETFRRATLVVLIVAGANLIRRGLLG